MHENIQSPSPIHLIQDLASLLFSRLYYSTYYVVPWCRAGPYLVGLAAGVLYHWLDDNNFMLTQVRPSVCVCEGGMRRSECILTLFVVKTIHEF